MLSRIVNRSIKLLVRCTYRRCDGGLEASLTSVAGQKRVIFSGIAPSGIPHLGNYLGAIKQWVELQKKPGDIYYTIADLCALSSPSCEELNKNALKMTACMLACGIDPERCIIFKQSDVKEIGLLSWVLSCVIPQNAVANLPEWTKNSQRGERAANLGLYTDPVLIGATCLLYKMTHVPVGFDQIVYQEFYREVARSFNQRYKTEYFPDSKYLINPNNAEVQSLQNPHSKMSKSEPGDLGRINITDSDDAIMQKMKQSVTDSDLSITFDPQERPGISNLIQIHSAVTGKSTTEICYLAQADVMDVEQYKVTVAEELIRYLKPIRMEYERLMKNKSYLSRVLRKGGEKARETAEKNWKDITEIISL